MTFNYASNEESYVNSSDIIKNVVDAQDDYCSDTDNTSDDITPEELSPIEKLASFEFDLAIAEEQLKESRRKRNGNVDQVQLWAEEFKRTHDIKYWEKIQKKLWPGLVAHCYKVVKNRELAEDVASVILMRAYERIDSYDIMKAKFGTWVWCIGFRQACRDLVLERRQPVALSTICGSDDSLENYVLGTATSDPDYSPYDDSSIGGAFSDINAVEVEYESSSHKLYDASINAIQSLKPELTRQVVTLKLLENKTIAQISEELSLTPSNVKNHLYRGKRMVAEKIKTDKTTSEIYNSYLETSHTINS